MSVFSELGSNYLEGRHKDEMSSDYVAVVTVVMPSREKQYFSRAHKHSSHVLWGAMAFKTSYTNE